MEIILRGITLLSMLFTLAMTVVAVLFSRKERRITLLAPFFSIVLSLIMPPIYLLFSGARLAPCLALPILALGLLLGFLGGLTTRLHAKDGQVMGKRSLFFLACWGASWALGEFLNLFGSTLLASAGLLPIFFSTGAQVGVNGNLFLFRLAFKPISTQAPPSLPESRQGTVFPPGRPERYKEAHPPESLPERGAMTRDSARTGPPRLPR